MRGRTDAGARVRMCLRGREGRGSLPIAAVVIVMLAAVPARGSEYIGLWKVDRDGDGVALDFPDNGFDGACARFSGGGEGEGQVRVESQMVRFRFDRVTMKAGGNVDPQNVHVQVSVKGKTVWKIGRAHV